jgi:signal transduction histidine kinase
VFEGSRGLFRRVGQERRSVDLNEITIEVLQSLRGELKEHGVTTRTELTSELPAVDGNKSQLQQVIFNLVRNALEAMDTTTDRTRVLKARMERHGCDAIIVAVEDSGPGIDPKKLGLAICRMIIERHEGQLSASLVDPRGAVFRIVLPVGRFGVV